MVGVGVDGVDGLMKGAVQPEAWSCEGFKLHRNQTKD